MPQSQDQFNRNFGCSRFDDREPRRVRGLDYDEADEKEDDDADAVDRNAVTLADGSPVTPDHRELKDNGQQKQYVVLSADERAKGFVRPVRRAYRHAKCGCTTTMSRSIAETYARDPNFYGGTFCAQCGVHFRLTIDGEPQFFWIDDDSAVGS